ncbi:MAG: hypothetical protein OWR62_14230 [Sulfobacillus thermotolerans]|nr:hypothetical protein [Sulfobacillus thermotolerans]
MKTVAWISGAAAVAAIVVGGIWLGSQSGHWDVVHVHHESVTIPASWHASDHGQAYVESGHHGEGLRFLARFSLNKLPRMAKPITRVSPHIHEWKIVRHKQVTYYAVWTDHGGTKAIRIRVPKSQETLGQTVLGSWQPS